MVKTVKVDDEIAKVVPATLIWKGPLLALLITGMVFANDQGNWLIWTVAIFLQIAWLGTGLNRDHAAVRAGRILRQAGSSLEKKLAASVGVPGEFDFFSSGIAYESAPKPQLSQSAIAKQGDRYWVLDRGTLVEFEQADVRQVQGAGAVMTAGIEDGADLTQGHGLEISLRDPKYPLVRVAVVRDVVQSRWMLMLEPASDRKSMA